MLLLEANKIIELKISIFAAYMFADFGCKRYDDERIQQILIQGVSLISQNMVLIWCIVVSGENSNRSIQTEQTV